MIAYLDTSVVLRAVFGEPDAFSGWAGVDYAVSSRILQNEALRTLDRRRVSAALPETLLRPGALAPAACRPPPPIDLTPDTP